MRIQRHSVYPACKYLLGQIDCKLLYLLYRGVYRRFRRFVLLSSCALKRVYMLVELPAEATRRRYGYKKDQSLRSLPNARHTR